ncbi:MAG: DUF2461 domain-containing protein [Actinomycetota bacterium]|nr:DUF2461 domain-containing protein [Actinomycetota bacterium]
MDNTKSFFSAHRDVYEESVRAPMVALLEALEPEFGPGKAFRPYRDVRYARDKTPYKTHQGGFVQHGASTGWYVQVGARGVDVGAGFYAAEPADLLRFREAVAGEATGRRLQRLLADLGSAGWQVGGDRLRTRPRGYDADHPRIELLRHRSLSVGRGYGFEPFIHTPDLLDRVRSDWAATRDLVEWVARALRG